MSSVEGGKAEGISVHNALKKTVVTSRRQKCASYFITQLPEFADGFGGIIHTPEMRGPSAGNIEGSCLGIWEPVRLIENRPERNDRLLITGNFYPVSFQGFFVNNPEGKMGIKKRHIDKKGISLLANIVDQQSFSPIDDVQDEPAR